MNLLSALSAANSSTRLNAALAAGTRPDPDLLGPLVERCAVEPDFFVRDMLTWALTRLPAELTVPRLRAELGSPIAQARGQALHTLSKIGDRGVWPAITTALLHDPDDQVARTAWRTASVLVPDEERTALAMELITEFGRGDRETRLSLSRSLVALGDEIAPLLQNKINNDDVDVRAHAVATDRLLHDPEAGFDLSVHEATRSAALAHTRSC